MRRFSPIFLLFMLIAAGCSKDKVIIGDPSSNTRPNILLVIADDLGIDGTPGYPIGAMKANMPHLEAMALEGITFDQVWSFPVCSPTRASILTGRYGYRTGVLNAEGASTIPITETTLQTRMDEATNQAYSHAIIGKWHLSNMEPSRPTDMGVGYYAGLLGGAVQDYFSWPLTQNGQTSQYSGYITTKITDLAIDWIDQQTQPWFCWLAYTAPHVPFHLPPDSLHSQGNLPTDQASIDANPLPYFIAMTESVDAEMGRLLDHLTTEERENTLIIFIGDNGAHQMVLQAPYTAGQGKGSLYQGGIHVPMIIAGKGVTRKNTRDESLINTSDLFATIAEITGATLPVSDDSYSFKDLLSQSVASDRVYNYSEVLNNTPNKSGYAIRNDRFKLIQFDNGKQELYDLDLDPYEQDNLMSGTLTTIQQDALDELTLEAAQIRQ
ncbi:MAG: sulfatase-like hydrolase/transferase [Saprospiraceae bacterium]|nr:sulfatase-like hydrolase/transferase [Saprospiraceae bacterium]